MLTNVSPDQKGDCGRRISRSGRANRGHVRSQREEDETSAACVPPRFQFPDDVGAAEAEFVQTVSTTLWAVVQALFEQHLLRGPGNWDVPGRVVTGHRHGTW